jgi:RNA polymerase primary sigma factor
MSDLSVMTPDEEKAAATKIATLRVTFWSDIFSYPPSTSGLLDVLESEMDAEDFPKAEAEALRLASRSLRDRETRSNKDAFATAVQALALLVGYSDVDGIISEKIVVDLVQLRRGSKRPKHVSLKPPREGSRPFAEYVNRIRATERALKRTKDAFVKCNLRLVVSIARRFNHGRMPLQDLIQEGNIGLMKAVDRFDHRKGFRFSTYGSWWIRHAISRAVADKGRQVRLPVHMIDAYHKVARAKREFEMKRGRDATLEELAEKTGLPLAKIQKMNGLLLDQAVSLDKPIGGGDDGEGRRLVDFLKDESGTAPGEQIATDAMNTQVKRLISRLRPIEADILRKRFGLVDDEELTLKEIGSQYSLSRERIRQLQEQALGKTIDKLLARAEQEEFDQSSKERLDALLLERQLLRRQREEAGK